MSSRIIFKTVGQGDSIIAEVCHADNIYIGIIDCRKKKDGTNPVIAYLQKALLDYGNDRMHIRTLILSHPHADHFDGMEGLLNFCEEKGLVIDTVMHTYWPKEISDMIREILNPEEQLLPTNYKNLLLKFIECLKLAKTQRIVENIYDLTARQWGNFVDHRLQMQCLSPSIEIRDHFLHNLRRSIKKRGGKYKVPAFSHYANLHAAVLRLRGEKDKEALLTSDAESIVFKLLMKDDFFWREVKNLEVAQVPHHGSDKNYLPEFWDKLSAKFGSNTKTAVVSVGENTYIHPSIKVLKSLHKLTYSITFTDLPGENFQCMIDKKNRDKEKLQHKSEDQNYISEICSYNDFNIEPDPSYDL